MSLVEFADKINQILPLIIKEFARRQTNEFYRGKITLPQFLVLDFLSKQSECIMTRLAHFMHVSTPAMTGIIERLVKSGYVLRVYDAQDRRIIRIKLTAKGEDLLKKVNQQRRQMILNIFGRISEKERQDYLRVLLHIKEILSLEKG